MRRYLLAGIAVVAFWARPAPAHANQTPPDSAVSRSVVGAIASPAQAPIERPAVGTLPRLARFLATPFMSAILLSLGILGLVLEIKASHFGLGGLVSLGSFGAFFGSGAYLGLTGWMEIILLVLGFLALAIEVFLLPGVGAAGILGLALIGAAIVGSLVGSAPTSGDLLQAAAVLGAALVITASVLIAWVRHLPHSHRFRHALLRDGHAAADGYVSALPRTELIGVGGIAVTDLRPSGTAAIGGERLDVVTEGEFVDAGTPITVVQSDGYRLIVRAAPAAIAPGKEA